MLAFARACALGWTVSLGGAGLLSEAWAQTPPASSPPAASASAGESASAPTRGSGPTSVLDVIAAEPVDLGAPDSPRASLAHYFDAARAGRWTDASRYLVLDANQQSRGAELARRLKAVIDDTGWIELETVSDAADGNVKDDLPPHIDEVGRFTLDGRTESLRMLRRIDKDGAYWAFAPSSVKRIDLWFAKLPDRRLRDTFVNSGLEFMLLPGPFELLWWQWLATAGLLIGAWLAGGLLSHLSRWLLRKLAVRTFARWDHTIAFNLARPFTLAWTLLLVAFGSPYLLLVTPAYHFIQGLTTAGLVLAGFWALWRGTGVATQQVLDSPWARESASARTLISVGAQFGRGAILLAGLLATLSALGYPIGTFLAGLGIGGLALAFGAQKTLENLFGSVAIAVDQPFRVGEVITVDGVTGLVENIGLRCTRLRTADRTRISIPNGKLADQRTESHAARDRYQLNVKLGLVYGTTREQIQRVLTSAEAVLRAHPQIWPDNVSVRLMALGASALEVEAVAWFDVPHSDAFVLCRQEVLLALLQVVEEAGTALAFPTQTVHVAPQDRS